MRLAAVHVIPDTRVMGAIRSKRRGIVAPHASGGVLTFSQISMLGLFSKQNSRDGGYGPDHAERLDMTLCRPNFACLSWISDG